MNVLRDTHNALVPGGTLLDFHPTYPPWARVEAAGETLGELIEEDFPEQLQRAEDGMRTVVEAGLYRRAARRRRVLREHYDDAEELIETWEGVVDPALERRLRATTGPVAVVDELVFDLYRAT